MTELERIAYAKTFIDKLANGINPLDNQPVSEQDVINNVKLARCFFYVSDILRQVIENGGIAPHKKQSSRPFHITPEQLSHYSYSKTPISISEIAKRLNALVDTEQMKPLSYRPLMDWLLSVDALTEQAAANGKIQKRPTETGYQLGISVGIRSSIKGEYSVVLYNENAQAYILEHISEIIASIKQ